VPSAQPAPPAPPAAAPPVVRQPRNSEPEMETLGRRRGQGTTPQ